jgi:hypothetical protein
MTATGPDRPDLRLRQLSPPPPPRPRPQLVVVVLLATLLVAVAGAVLLGYEYGSSRNGNHRAAPSPSPSTATGQFSATPGSATTTMPPPRPRVLTLITKDLAYLAPGQAGTSPGSSSALVSASGCGLTTRTPTSTASRSPHQRSTWTPGNTRSRSQGRSGRPPKRAPTASTASTATPAWTAASSSGGADPAYLAPRRPGTSRRPRRRRGRPAAHRRPVRGRTAAAPCATGQVPACRPAPPGRRAGSRPPPPPSPRQPAERQAQGRGQLDIATPMPCGASSGNNPPTEAAASRPRPSRPSSAQAEAGGQQQPGHHRERRVGDAVGSSRVAASDHRQHQADECQGQVGRDRPAQALAGESQGDREPPQPHGRRDTWLPPPGLSRCWWTGQALDHRPGGHAGHHAQEPDSDRAGEAAHQTVPCLRTVADLLGRPP